MEWTQQLHQNPHKQFSICTHVVPAQPQNKQTVIRFQCLNNPCFLHTPILPYFLLQIGARATQDFLDRLTCCSIVSDLTAFLTENTALLVFSPITRSVSSEYWSRLAAKRCWWFHRLFKSIASLSVAYLLGFLVKNHQCLLRQKMLWTHHTTKNINTDFFSYIKRFTLHNFNLDNIFWYKCGIWFSYCLFFVPFLTFHFILNI